MNAAVREYASIFTDSEENRRIDAEIRRAKYAVKKGIPLDQVDLAATPTVGQSALTDDDPLGDFSIPVPQDFKDWTYSSENWLRPINETLLFIINMIPVLFMCNILALEVYPEYDEIATEILCYNKAFEGFRLLWVDDGNTPLTKVLDFSKYGY